VLHHSLIPVVSLPEAARSKKAARSIRATTHAASDVIVACGTSQSGYGNVMNGPMSNAQVAA
jgi:hypothetical protein